MKKILLLMFVLAGAFTLTACDTDATIVSENLSKEAEQFRIRRRIVFINGITDQYMFEMTGNCSIEVDAADDQLEVTCKTGDDKYAKHFLGLSDNVTYIVEQLEYTEVSKYDYEIVFKPESIIPIDITTE